MNPTPKLISPKAGQPIREKFLEDLCDRINKLESVFGGPGMPGMTSSDFIVLAAAVARTGVAGVRFGVLDERCRRNAWGQVTPYKFRGFSSIDPITDPTFNPNGQFEQDTAARGYAFAWTVPAGYVIPAGANVTIVKLALSVDDDPLYSVVDWDKCLKYVGA